MKKICIFFNSYHNMSFWAEDHAPCPVGPFLLDEVQARGELIHKGPGIRDSAGPVAIGIGIRVLPHEYEDGHQGSHQDVAGRELSTEDGQKATHRPLPPLPETQSGKNKASSKVKVAISNLTKKQWFKLDDDARALEIVWVKQDSNRHKLAIEDKRVLPSKTAHECLELYRETWDEKAPPCVLWPEFGGPTKKANPIHKSDTPPSLPTNRPPSRTVKMRERTPPLASTRGRAVTPSATLSPRVHDRLGPKAPSAYDRLGPKTPSAYDRLGPKVLEVGKPVDTDRPRPEGPSTKVLACRAAAKAVTTKHQGLGDQPSDKVTTCKPTARKRQQDRGRNSSTTRDPPKRRRGEAYEKQSGGGST